MTTGILNSTQFPVDLAAKSFDSMITRLMPNGTAPLFGMTSMLKSETAVQTEHGFFTKTMVFPFITFNGAIDNVQTVIPVLSTLNIVPGMVLRVNNTNAENMLVTNVNSDTAVTVQRGFGGTAAAGADTVSAYQIGNAYEEASIRPVPVSIKARRVTNLTQIFRNTWAISGTVQATQMIAGDSNEAENRQDCAAFHATSIESSIFFGRKFEGQRNGQPIRAMDGLISIVSNLTYYPSSYITPNVTTAGGTTNYTQLEAMVDPVFNQTTDPKVANERAMFVGGVARRVINNIGRLNGTYFLTDGQTSYGLQFSSFKTARGTFRLIEHPLFNSNPAWQSMAVVVDLSSFGIAYLGGRKTENKEFNASGAVANDFGIDALGGTLTTEMTCTVKNPPANAIIYGLTAAAQG